VNQVFRDPWIAESEAIELDEPDLGVADAAELPAELIHHALAAGEDENFDVEFNEWLGQLSGDPLLMLALEQSCDEGILLPWDMRGVRLSTAPPEVLERLHLFMSACPSHVAAHLVHTVYWLVRSERSRRRGHPEWTPKHPLPPLIEERAFFRPSRLTIRRYS
jgi:hypothetical protein